MSVVLHEAAPSPRECGHASLDLLGSEGSATFYQCSDCGSVVILAGGDCWILRSAMLP